MLRKISQLISFTGNFGSAWGLFLIGFGGSFGIFPLSHLSLRIFSLGLLVPFQYKAVVLILE